MTALHSSIATPGGATASPETPREVVGGLSLEIRTPNGVLYAGPISRLRAEDLSGWFGLLPGRPDLLSVLRQGLLVFEDEAGEVYVANGGGTLDLRGGRCAVMLRSAVMTRSSDDLAGALAKARAHAQSAKRAQQETLDVLIDEAVRRATEPDPSFWSRR